MAAAVITGKSMIKFTVLLLLGIVFTYDASMYLKLQYSPHFSVQYDHDYNVVFM